MGEKGDAWQEAQISEKEGNLAISTARPETTQRKRFTNGNKLEQRQSRARKDWCSAELRVMPDNKRIASNGRCAMVLVPLLKANG
jgi:hypothetical protein